MFEELDFTNLTVNAKLLHLWKNEEKNALKFLLQQVTLKIKK